MKSKRISIKWKIFLYLVCFCSLLLAILWLFQTVLLDSFYRYIKVNEIKKMSETISNNLDNDDDLYLLLESFSQRNDCQVAISDANGKIIVQSMLEKHDSKPLALEPYLKKLKDGYYLEYQKTGELNPERFEDVQKQKTNPFQSLIYLKRTQDKIIYINARISPVDATINTLRYQLYCVTGIMILLSVILALLISKRVSAPIEKINRTAKSLSDGRYDIIFENTGYREISELSDTLNVAANELKKVESLRKELMANISHDLRTPLSLIYGYAEVMHDFPEDITPEKTQVIMDETKRLSHLVSDVLDISNLESGNQSLNIREFCLTDSISLTTMRVAELVKKDMYSITFESDKRVNVFADEIKLTTAFYNLLINAINYTGEDKTIKVTQTVADDVVRISVTDTGEGITDDNLKYVWDRYYRVDKNHKRPITGTGLGLAIVKKIIELHKGSYGVISTPGKGSTFWFSLKIQT